MTLLLGNWRTDSGLALHDGRFGITAAEVPVADPPSVLANDGLAGSGQFTPVLQSLPAGATAFEFDDDGSLYYLGPDSSFSYQLYEDGVPVGSVVTVTLGEAATNQPPVYTGSLAPVSGIAGTPFPALDFGSGFDDPEAAPLVFAKLGTWPASITLSALGVTGGTFPAAGSYALQVQATDDGGLSAVSDALAVTATLDEAPENQPPVYTGSLAPVSGIAGTPFPALDFGSGFDDPEAGPLVFAKLGAWPASITLSALGVTGGTFPASGSYALQVQATDDGGLSAASSVVTVIASVLPIAGNIGIKVDGTYADVAGIYAKSGALYVSAEVYAKAAGVYQRLA